MAEEKKLTKEQEAFLEECELEFSNRFTESDLEYQTIADREFPKPPIIENWCGRRGGGYRGGNRRRNHRDRSHDDHSNSGYRDDHRDDYQGSGHMRRDHNRKRQAPY